MQYTAAVTVAPEEPEEPWYNWDTAPEGGSTDNVNMINKLVLLFGFQYMSMQGYS